MSEFTAEQIRMAVLRTFHSDDGRITLQYLAEFAKADDADFCLDARKSEYLQGRRSVVLEIRKIINGEKFNGEK